MKVSLQLIRDSFNSHPQDSLEFEVFGDTVTITVDDNNQEREMTVDRAEFLKLLKVVEI